MQILLQLRCRYKQKPPLPTPAFVSPFNKKLLPPITLHLHNHNVHFGKDDHETPVPCVLRQ
jgi:hypothetical protein